MELDRREVPLYVSVFLQSVNVFVDTFFTVNISSHFKKNPVPCLYSSLSLQAIPLLSLSPDSPSVHWLTGKPCATGETQARRVSVPGEARP